MGSLPLHFCIIIFILTLTPHSQSASDFTTVVYKGCAKQSFSSDPSGAFSQALSSLFGTLISQSSKSKFFKTTAGTGQSAINGLFQCRGDLSNVDCYTCVSKLPILIDRLCGKPVAARMHLFGCYMLYEVSGFAQISGMEMLYKSCSEKNIGGSGFEEKRDTALNSLENGMSGTGGFYTASVESVRVMGQCEGDVGISDCVECVKSAVQRAQVECGSSVGAQIYLHKCFISYGDYANGPPKRSSASASFNSPSSSSPGAGPNAGKTVAIIVGGAAGVGFLNDGLNSIIKATNARNKGLTCWTEEKRKS
ncbi:cysteine-rich repeat secretory protein 3 [Phtheirospermum japonicum]|uniref:Cysteine-rich repeat secretory protein 3 n=1 Tax=Phtheirospermum japonicum TaxID=374723 RepID=A0A830CWC1_9LAMI|nr:cysteine-rich repeat secretory protein 3 [Phtheirospermum japonicum]